MVRYDRVSKRVYVLRVRIHHGVVGLALVVAGSALIAHDWRDHRTWFHFREPEVQ